MATKGKQPEKKPHITNEQLTEIKRLYREGRSLSEIARTIGCHRQTVRAHLREKHQDIVADEVRKQVLVEELRNHYRQLGEFAREGLRVRLDALSIYSEGGKESQRREPGPLFTGGTMALPDTGRASFRCEDWIRMYRPSTRESFLLESLREHTKELPLWISWDRWRTIVAEYETASQALFEWVEKRTEAELFEKVGPAGIESYRRWVFGNILLTASNKECENLEDFRHEFVYMHGVIIIGDQGSDEDAALYEYLYSIVQEAQQMPEWARLRSAIEQLKQKEIQLEFRRIAKDLDYALAGIELMNAFPGRCNLCPV
ncbi:helix-turn-helix domain-containing protein [Chloroflexota bacterium]